MDGGSLAAGGQTTLNALKRLDSAWLDLRTREVYGLTPKFVYRTKEVLPCTPGLDVIVAGGTLGIILAAALQANGVKTAVVERGIVQGRDQEWNLSRRELYELVDAGVLTKEQAEDCIQTEFNPVRAAFHGSKEVITADVLNLGISPRVLIECIAKNYQNNGGIIVESTSLSKVFVHPNGIQLRGKTDGKEIAVTSKLLIDCMGNQSPVVKQVRHGRKPDGVCIVVGTCARGFPEESNSSGDVICTVAPSEPAGPTPSNAIHNTQMFWEAFPAGSGPSDRTTYMFTYMDAEPNRPSILQLMEHYWDAMPEYQSVRLEQLEIQRVLFGLFPTYKDSPLTPSFDRILAIGDAGGMQSPLSFGGVAALTRHLSRLTTAITDAITLDCTDRESLKFINAYNPSLSGAWMLQKAMSIPSDASRYDRNFINRLLGENFAVMREQGDDVLKPFLQDVIQAKPLTKTLLGQMRADPFFIPAILGRVGPGPITEWLLHYIALVAYTGMYTLSKKLDMTTMAEKLPPRQKFLVRRAIERWQYGSGLDAGSH